MIACPYCKFDMEIKGARPGRFRPKCPQCGKQFVMVVPEMYGEAIEISPIESASGAAETVARPTPKPQPKPSQVETIPPVAKPSEAATLPPSGKPTGAYDKTVTQTSIKDKLGGYEILRTLGVGGMGEVYLARQISLDRPVAVKVMNPEWAKDPIFLARFIREAYAAASLVHHNVVQIYDIDEDNGKNFFSMEFVDGQSLGDLIREKGRLEIDIAVGYILQAARGLKFAHDKRMIHRDIKPDNLMLNREGIVKVADLGLVKTPESVKAEDAPRGDGPAGGRGGVDITDVNRAMGTPAYMAPEQVMDASSVDQRADIYSLGCTLYTMVTGRAVFDGKTAEEIMTKQTSQPIERPEAIVKGVPRELSDILMKMLAKNPAARYQDLGAVIDELQEYIGVKQSEIFRPGEGHAQTLEEAVGTYNGAKSALLRRGVIAGFFAIASLFFVGLVVAVKIVPALAVLGALVATPLAYLFISGAATKSIIFAKFRQYLRTGNPRDWYKPLLIGILFLVLVWVLNLHWVALGVAVGAVLFAAGFHFTVDRKLTSERRESMDQVRQLLRTLRLEGLGEDPIREFVCRFSGENWEPMYEAIFGYDAKMVARELWGVGDDGSFRPRHGAWRDKIILWIEARERWRKHERDRKLLMKIERKALEATGVPELKARKQAERAAQDMVTQASQTRSRLPGYVDVPIAKYRLSFTSLLFGAKARFTVGLILIAMCVVWMHQNDLIPGREIKDIGAQMIEDKQLADAGEVRDTLGESLTLRGKSHKSLELPGLPAGVAKWFDSYNPGLAGLVLVISGLFGGVQMTFFLLPAVMVIMFGHAWGIPAVWKIPQEFMSMAAGGVLALLALYFGRQ